MTLQGILLDLAIAAAAGGLVGVERQQAMSAQPERDFGGIRTFPLIAILGCVGALLTPELGPWVLITFLVSVTVLLAMSHVRSPMRDAGLTSEFAAMVTFGAGAIAGSHHLLDSVPRYLLVASLAAVTMALLALKKPLHG